MTGRKTASLLDTSRNLDYDGHTMRPLGTNIEEDSAKWLRAEAYNTKTTQTALVNEAIGLLRAARAGELVAPCPACGTSLQAQSSGNTIGLLKSGGKRQEGVVIVIPPGHPEREALATACAAVVAATEAGGESAVFVQSWVDFIALRPNPKEET
jgi:hypothetical protein